MTKENKSDIDWAEIIDLLASEYGWTIEYIKALNLGQIVTLMKKIQIRREKHNGSSDSNITPPNSTGGVDTEDELSISDFETKLGGKKVVENGVTKIIL